VDITLSKAKIIKSARSRAFYAAGRPHRLHFDPTKVNAAIVTCGGICPGLNNVIREIVHALYNTYGVNQVWGVSGGWNGFHQDDYPPPVVLTNEMVENVHHDGGTFLRTSRGGLDVDKTIDFLKEKSISHLYVLGGDGTHRAAYKVHEACRGQNLNISIAGVPKTIDNDIDYVDKTFGFSSVSL
jgi:6-phosphofructokinase 1